MPGEGGERRGRNISCVLRWRRLEKECLAYRGEIKAARLRGLDGISGFQTRIKYMENEDPGRGFGSGLIKLFLPLRSPPSPGLYGYWYNRLNGKSVFTASIVDHFIQKEFSFV